MVDITTKNNSNNITKKRKESVSSTFDYYRASSLLDKLKLNDHKHLSPLCYKKIQICLCFRNYERGGFINNLIEILSLPLLILSFFSFCITTFILFLYSPLYIYMLLYFILFSLLFSSFVHILYLGSTSYILSASP
jgi:hypothetical protein